MNAMPLCGAVFAFPGGVAAGFAALITTGLSWSLVGIVMGSAPKRKIDTDYIQFFSALAGLTVSLVILLLLPEHRSGGGLLAVGCYFFTGAINFLMLEFMAAAMKRGPNGIIWGMIQSGTMWPFVMGVVCFGVTPTPLRLIGMAALTTALFLFGRSPNNNASRGRTWLRLALIAFCLCGVQQCLTSMPSYFPALRTVSPVMRSALVAVGTVFGAIADKTVLILTGRSSLRSGQLRRPALWGYVLVMQGFGLAAAYFLMYNGMDTLAAHGMGAISYPLMVASCIVGFSLYSIFILRENNRLPQYLAFALCLAGILCLCAG